MKNLNDVDSKIISARKTGHAISDLSKEEFEASLTGIIFNVSVLCGCQLPTHEAHINALEKEFTIFLKEYGYSNFTPEEILTAFRMNSNFQLEDKIETYGALFNVDFAGKVLSQYREKRFSLDYKLANWNRMKVAKMVLEEEATARRIHTKKQFEKYLSGDTSGLDLSNCYMQLNDDNAFKNTRTFELFTEGTERGGEISLQEALKNYGETLNKTFEAQKRAVLFLFKSMKESGRLVIYDEDLKLVYPGFEIPEIVEEEKDLPPLPF